MTAIPSLLVKDHPCFILPKRFIEFRQEQLTFAHQAVELFLAGADVVVMEGSVGFGKSLFAEMVRQLLKMRMLMVVPRIDLQEQFLDSFPYSRLLQGRSNYPHGGRGGRRDYPEITCADCKKENFCADTGCEYKAKKQIFLGAGVGVTNLTYFLAAANHLKMFKPSKLKPGQPQPRETWSGEYLTCFDEADVIEDALLDFLGCEIRIPYIQNVLDFTNMSRRYTIPAAPVRDFSGWFNWVKEIIKLLRACLERYGEPDQTDIQGIRFHTRLVKTIISLQGVREDWVYDPTRSEGKSGRKTGDAWKITLKPKMVGELGAKSLWNYCGKTLIMSGTIVNLNTWVEETGLIHTDKKVEFLRFESPWEKHRRSVHRVGGINMGQRDRTKAWRDQEFWDQYIGNIASILLRFPNERTLIHSVSHDLAGDIGDSLTEIFDKHKIIVDKGEREKVNEWDTPEERERKLDKSAKLNEYLRTPGGVLVSAKLGRGTDLKDWRCRNIILAKCPFASLGDRRIKARLNETETGQLWYRIKAVREIIQYFGRGNRHELDWVRIWVMDDAFDQIVELRGLLPKYFRDSIRHKGDYSTKWPALQELEIGDLLAA